MPDILSDRRPPSLLPIDGTTHDRLDRLTAGGDTQAMAIGKRLVLKFKMWLGYDPTEDEKLPPDLLHTDPAEHFRTWDRGLRRWWGG